MQYRCVSGSGCNLNPSVPESFSTFPTALTRFTERIISEITDFQARHLRPIEYKLKYTIKCI